MTRRICLVTTGQPSTNPRLVKEADALVANGYEVHVVGAHWAEWADRTDAQLKAGRAWSVHVIDWRREHAPWLFWKTRVRHFLARSTFDMPVVGQAFGTAAVSRLTPELEAAAIARPADLYIAHNLGALPAAAAAAQRHGGRLGFDAEDYHRGQLPAHAAADRALVRAIEERYLPGCDYVTAASPGIASAYAALCRTPPVVVLNVFPLADRPAAPAARRDGPFRLYWFSQTIGRDRGLEDVIRAIGMAGRAIELHLRGAWQAGYAADLEVVARAAGVRWDRIISHEPAPPAEMVRLAATADVGVAVETGQTVNADVALSNKLFTYLLAGVPVLASATSAQAELARGLGDAATLAPVGDATALAAALRGWLERPDELAAAHRAAWHLGTTRYNWDVEQARFLGALRAVLNDHDPGLHRVRGLAS